MFVADGLWAAAKCDWGKQETSGLCVFVTRRLVRVLEAMIFAIDDPEVPHEIVWQQGVRLV
jgi:hypothetical protein